MKPIYCDLLVLLIIALLGGVIGWVIKPCPTCLGATVIEVHDSIAPAKDTGIIAINSQPKLKETHKYSPEASRKNGTLAGDFRKTKVVEFDHLKDNTPNEGELKPTEFDTFANYSLCLDTNIYTVDTQSVDNFKAHATATVSNNQLIGLHIEYQNFKPEKWKVLSKTDTVEKKQSLVKVYMGLYGGVAIQNKTVASYHGGIGLDAIISDRHMIGLQGGLNSSLQSEIMIRFSEKIRLKK